MKRKKKKTGRGSHRLPKGKSARSQRHPPWGRESAVPTEKRTYPLWQRLILSVVSAGLFFALLEGLLHLGGIRPLLYEEDPYVGFTASSPLFVPQPSAGRGSLMVTAPNKRTLFNEQRFDRRKSKDSFRIFCLGGSTTYGRPYDDSTSFCGFLRAFLAAAEPSRRFEVINAGGISYASYRVALLMEELIEYQPDLFIVLSGHNEFLEKRTYSQIIRTPRAVRWIGAAMGNTRTYAALNQLIESLDGSADRPSAGGELLPSEVVTELEKSVGPEAYHRDDGFKAQVLAHYRYNLNRMIDIAHSVGSQILLVTPSSNLKDCSPFKSEHRSDMSRAVIAQFDGLLGRAARALELKQVEQGLGWVEQAIGLDDRYAAAHYLRGRLLWSAERFEEARVEFVRARDEDICPLRALSTMLDIVSNTATERQVPTVDFNSWTATHSDHGTPGEQLFLDHVHPDVDTHQALAVLLLDTMKQEGMIESSLARDRIARISDRIKNTIDHQAHAKALRNLAFVLGWAGKTDESKRLARRAEAMLPTDAATQFRLGANAEAEGNGAEAIRHFQRALELQPDHLQTMNRLGQALMAQASHLKAVPLFQAVLSRDAANTVALYNLGNAAVITGDLPGAVDYYRRYLVEEPEAAQVISNLGSVLSDLGRHEEAVREHRRALDLDPKLSQAHFNLANALFRQQRFDEAIEHFRHYVRAEPDQSIGHTALGKALAANGKVDEAITALEVAMAADPNQPAPVISAARLLAGHPDPQRRDLSRALNLARRAADLTNHRNAKVLTHLAEIYAASGQNDMSAKTARSAVAIAVQSNRLDLVNRLKALLADL